MLQLWASPPPDSFVATISIQPSSGFHSGPSELRSKYPSLKAKWNKIRDAKIAYEKAGGTYE